MEDKFDIISILQELGDDIVADMQKIIQMNGSIGTGRLLNNIKTKAIEKNDKYNLIISYPFYGKFVDEGRKAGKMPPLDYIIDWTKLKGIPASAAFPIAKSIGKNGTKGINFTKPFYNDIKVIADILGDKYSKHIIKVITKELIK